MGATSSLNINSGLVQAGGLDTSAATAATINLNGGTLQTLGWTAAATTALNLNGGTLRAAGASANFLGATTANKVTVYAAGATIDTNGSNITITQNLVGGTGSGVSSVAVSTPDNSTVFTSPPAVTFTGGGATGYATLDANGHITGIVVTNPGSYATAPAASIAGSSAVLTISSASNTGGGLSKIGVGTLALGGPNNTFIGPVTITAGTLAQSGSLLADVHDQAAFVYTSGAFGGRLFVAGGATATFNADFTAAGGMVNDANVLIASGRTITLNGAGLDNEGTLTMSGGTLALGANIAHSNQGEIDVPSGSTISLANGAMLTNNATLNLTVIGITGGTVNGSGGTLVNKGIMFGPGTINSGFNNNGGTVIVTPGTTKILPAFINSGLIELTGVGSVLSGGVITITGTLQGLGTVVSAVTNSAGRIEASSGGTLAVGGTLQNQANGTLTASTGSKLLVTTGLASNAGLISLNGGTFDNNGHPLNNTGRISGFGIFRTGGSGLDNNGTINFSGGLTTVDGNVTNENGQTITVNDKTIFNGLVTNNLGGTINTVNTTTLNPAEFVGGFTNNTGSQFTKTGGGLLEVASGLSNPFTLKDSSSLAINAGSMMLSIASGGSATIGTGVTATVSSTATLELAGSVSNLSSGSGSSMSSIVNNSTAAPGVLITGTHQIVGYIRGTGITEVGAGDDLTANGIVGGGLVIGNSGRVTIGTSDAEGNPLADAPDSTGLILARSLVPSNPLPPEAALALPDDSPSALSIDSSLTPRALSFSSASAVPEPSSLLLAVLAIGGALAASLRRGWAARKPECDC